METEPKKIGASNQAQEPCPECGASNAETAITLERFTYGEDADAQEISPTAGLAVS